MANGKTDGMTKLLIILFLYGAVMMIANLDFNSAYHDEALNILMGREVIAGVPCASCAQNTGSVIIQPVIAALADARAGLIGARAAGIPFGLGLAWIIYLTGASMLSDRHGFLSAAIFLLSGTTLYLSKLATYDIIAAFFLGLSLYWIVHAEKKRSSLLLFAAAFALFLAAMTKYVVAVYMLPFILYAFWRHGIVRATLLFAFPLVVLTGLYTYYALYPVREIILGSASSVYTESKVPFDTLLNWTFRWLAMPYLLAIFGLFHDKHGSKAFALILLSTPIALLHLLTGTEQSVNKNVIFAITVLSPACALGVAKMGSLFSTDIARPWVKHFFAAAVLIVVWTYGIADMKWLERQYPDLTPVIHFFNENGTNGMTAAIDSDFGDAAYRYNVSPTITGSQFFAIRDILDMMHQGFRPDFIIFDGYYGKAYYRDIAQTFIAEDYSLVRTFQLRMSWGTRDLKIYKRRLAS